MSSRLVPVVGIVCCLLVSACSDKPPRSGASRSEPEDAGFLDGGGAESSTALAREFGAELRQVQCERIFECCSAQERDREFDIQAESPEEACQSESALFGSTLSLQRFDKAIAEGRLRYNPKLAEQCLTSHRQRSCSNLQDVPPFSTELPGCGAVLEPLVSAGGTCGSDRECRTGYCASGPNSNETTCRVPPTQGEACPNLRCRSGLYCDRFQAELTCKFKREHGESCTEDVQCRSGICDGTCLMSVPACEGS